MTRSFFVRLAAVAAAVGVVASCDTRLPSTTVTPGGSTETGFPPVTIIDTPLVGQFVNLGDSVYLSLRLSDDIGLSFATVSAFTIAGDPDLGTLTQVLRFGPLRIPGPTGNFRAGLLDTVIRRYLKPNNPATLVPDDLIIVVRTTDATGQQDSVSTTVRLVSGPAVSIGAPISGDSVPAGSNLSIETRALHPDGVASLRVRVRGEPTWPTLMDQIVDTTFAGAPRDVSATFIVPIPADAPQRGRFTITASALDANQQPGSAPTVVQYILSTTVPPAPRVTQVVQQRSEITDFITVSANGGGITRIGVLVRDPANGSTVKDTSVALPAPHTANVKRDFRLDLPISAQGRHLVVTGYAEDQDGRIGYAVRTALSSPVTSLAAAFAESTLVVYGRTFPMPRAGIVGDIAVDEVRGNIFVSSMDHNRLEVWQNGPKAFDPLGVAVGSQPWGLNISVNPDELLVANSGGDNISRVFIGTNDPRQIREDLQRRIRTRMNVIFQVTESRDASTGKITLRITNRFMYSDRPQYVGQTADSTIYFSTRPTVTRPEGVIRFLNPNQAFPDLRTFLILGQSTPATTFLIVDADDVEIIQTPAASNAPDTLVVYGHPPGTNALPTGVKSGDGVVAAVEALNLATGGDVRVVQGFSPAGLTDTTFVALSRDRNWIAFGTGNTSTAGNIMMRSSAAFGSPTLTQQDLRNNASERIFGLAIDSVGLTVGARGDESYFASVDLPFHLRLQGKYSSFAQGAGMAFHPAARGHDGNLAVPPSPYTDDTERTAFVASDNFTIEIVDIAHFVNRGRLNIKHRLYGPLRVTRALPGDPPDVILKLYGVTPEGLVVIDLRSADILPVP